MLNFKRGLHVSRGAVHGGVFMDVRKKRLVRIGVGLGLLGCAAGLLALQMDLAGQMARCLDFVRAEGAGMFFTAMAVLPFFGFPLSAFVLSAGPVFAPTLGPGVVIACGVAALAVNVSLSYWVAAVAMRPGMERLILWIGYPVPVLPEGKSWEFTLLLRVVPGVPFFFAELPAGTGPGAF